MNCKNTSWREYFLCGMRFFFGIWLLYVGVTKWLFIGPNNFVGFISSEFSKTWSPPILTTVLAWLILVAEPLLAVLILWGRHARAVWSLTTLLMFLLVMGQSLLMKPDVIGNWQFLMMTLVCAALANPEDGKD